MGAEVRTIACDESGSEGENQTRERLASGTEFDGPLRA